MKGEWCVGPDGRVRLDTTGDTSAQLAQVQAERDAANTLLAQVTAERDQARAARDALAAQLAKLEAAIQTAGITIQHAEPA